MHSKAPSFLILIKKEFTFRCRSQDIRGPTEFEVKPFSIRSFLTN